MSNRNLLSRWKICLLISLALLLPAASSFGQSALLLEQPFGVFGTLNPTGHAAIYLEHVCAETPVHLRKCNSGETGVVISRYKGMAHYDWIAIPLIPYLYAVEDATKVPAEVDQDTVDRMRQHYKEAVLDEWIRNLPKGNFFYDGWVELVGTAYDRRTYAFRFDTTPQQDQSLIDKLNSGPNHSHFNILFNNCADFDRSLLNQFFPGTFHRSILPDGGITTPKQITHSLIKYAKKHPDTQLTILEIPQVPGFRHHSHSVDGVSESLLKNGYVLPIVILNPYVAGGILADYLVQGRYKLVPKNPTMVDAQHLDHLTHSLTGSSTDPQPTGSPDATTMPAASTPNSAPISTLLPAQDKRAEAPAPTVKPALPAPDVDTPATSKPD